jgi:hypothetical protein
MPGFSPQEFLSGQSMFADPNILAVKLDNPIEGKVSVSSNPHR